MVLSRAYGSTALTHLSLLIALIGGCPHLAHANPEDGVVSAGSAIITSSDNKLNVHQSSDRVIIDWRSFNIGIDEHTQFYQPSSNSVALNRVNDANPSYILGKLSANGNVILINPNGVMFGAGSRVDVNGLIATTADITNQNFMDGNLHFDRPGNPDAIVLNEGYISAKEAGLVGLVAPNVINSGIIEAKLGRIHLAGGDTATIDLYGDGLMEVEVSDDVQSQIVMNTGTLSAEGGTIAMTASAGKEIVNNLVVVKGQLKAPAVGVKNGKISIFAEGSNAVKGNVAADKGKKKGQSNVIVQASLDVSGLGQGERGGDITVAGDGISILNGSIMNASGHSGRINTTDGKIISDIRDGSAGGNIRIGGDYLGQGDTATAKNLFVDTYTLFYNDAIESGDAGRTIFWSDNDTTFKGNVYARGGIDGGNGGFLETSGHSNLVAQGYADLTAVNGHKGTYFLDPTNITIYGNFSPSYDSSGGEINLYDASVGSDPLALWLDGADSSSIVQSGGAVSAWNDKSRNGNNALQNNASFKPIYNSSTGTITFDGSQDYLDAGPLSQIENKSGLSLFFVLKTSSVTENQAFFGGWDGNDGVFFQTDVFPTGKALGLVGGGTSFGSTAGTITTPEILSTVYDGTLSGNANILKMYLAGAQQTMTFNGGAIYTTTPDIADNVQIGADTSISRYFGGDMNEVIIYNRALTNDERTLVEQYQSAKWNLALDPFAGAGAEAAEAMDSTNGYSVFTTRYLERLSQSADISLQASNDIKFDLKGDTLTLAADRNLTLTAGNDIKSASDSFGTIATSRTGMGGNITMTAGRHLDLSNVVLTTGGGNVSLTATTGDVTLNTINSGTGSLDVTGQNVYLNLAAQYRTMNLMGYWGFNEGAGTAAGDSSGNGNNGTLVNGVSWSSDTPTGAGNTGSLSFDGSNDYVLVSDANSLDLTNGFTISTWVKSNGVQTNRYLISKTNGVGSDNVYSVIYGYSANQAQFYASGNAFGYPSSNSNISIADTSWHQITYTYDGATFKSYKDGVQTGSMNLTADLSASTGNLIFGNFTTGSGYNFNGLMDEVRIYNAALSPAEIARLAQTPTAWMTGNTTINAANNIALNLESETLAVAAGSNITLNAGNNISSSANGLLQASGAGNIFLTAGNDINFANDLDLNVTGTGAATVRAGNSIIYTGGGDITTQGGTITLNSDYHATTPNNLGAIYLGSGTNITSNNGNILVGGGTDGTGYAYGTATHGSGINLNSSIVSSGTGTITMHGNGYEGGSVADEHGIWIQNSGGGIQSTSGNISLYGRGGVGTTAGNDGWGNLGVYVMNSNISSNSGNIIVDGLSGTGNLTWNTGTAIYTGSSVRTAGNGTINITGTNNNAIAGSQLGVWIGSGNSYIESQNGAMTVTGTAARATVDSYGLYLSSSANGLRTTGSGNINVNASADVAASDIYFGAAFGFGSGTASGNITINANKINVAAAPTITTTGTVTFAPRTTNTSMGVAGGAGTLAIPNSILNNISASTVIFGRNDGASILTLGARDWSAGNYNVRAINGSGRIAFASGVNALGNHTFFAQNTGDTIRMQAGSSITSTAAGNAVTLVSGTGFTNMSGSASPITVAGGGRWLIYMPDSASGSSLNSMGYDFRRFSCSYGGSCPAFGTGSGMLYANTPVLTVTPDAITRTYGDAAPNLTGYAYTIAGWLDAADNIMGGITGSLNGVTSYTQTSNASASYNINYDSGSLVSALGYGFSYANNASAIAVNKATVTVAADDVSMLQGTTPTITYRYAGFVNGQNFATSGITGAPSPLINPDTRSGGIYDVDLNFSGLGSTNYQFLEFLPKGILTVQSKPVTNQSLIPVPFTVLQTISNPQNSTEYVQTSNSEKKETATVKTGTQAESTLSTLVTSGELEITPEVKKKFNLCMGSSDGSCGEL